MPIYEYKCLKNGHVFEVLQAIGEKPVKVCEICKSPVEKLVSSAAFHLKGSGWYTTDYKTSSKPAEAPQQAQQAEAKTEVKKEGEKKK